MNIKRMLIVNRGEIAVRIIRAARELGVTTIQAYSDADQDSLAVKLADETVHIGESPAAKSYLCVEKIMHAASQCRADAIHPGYGFLSESAEFAQAVADAGMIFVGPSAQTIRRMGDKVSARQAADAAGVPTVPGSWRRLQGPEDTLRVAEIVGFPLLLKASAGGGGRGIRIVSSLDDLSATAAQAASEAQSAFGDGGLYIEKYIERGRHIEVQILGDGERVVHLFERECSLQRRRQKVWEEAPAALIPSRVRKNLCQAAVDLARSVNYRGAGTVEFLYDCSDQSIYFLEMNTRIQVEHPITEMITGIDLVREMIRVCGGAPLSLQQSDIQSCGHSIEVRINAEDPRHNFMPNPGVVEFLQLPGGPGVRFDTCIYPGYSIPPFYDSLLGKLIVWAEDREACLARMGRALGELTVGGVNTTAPLHRCLVQNASVKAGEFNTNWLETWLTDNAESMES